jgi:triphosphoribosyl-dephospho-CoA synthase
MRFAPAAIEAAYRAACELDVTALKPGNVRDGAPFADMTAADFRASASATASILAGAAAEGVTIGTIVRRAIGATRAVVHCNTNLGIVLLAAPLCRAAARGDFSADGVLVELDALTRADAVDVYAAIREAAPGGLGRRADHDVADEPQVTLREAMCAAATDDAIARQYCRGFGDIFTRGVAAWRRGIALFSEERAATSWLYMQFLASFPDSHLVRRRGAAVARAVRARARAIVADYERDAAGADLAATGAGTRWRSALDNWDEELRGNEWNPGTSADLTVASILAAKLAPTV